MKNQTRKARRPDTVTVFSIKIKKFVSILGKLELVSTDELNEIYNHKPKELFTRFMVARIERIKC